MATTIICPYCNKQVELSQALTHEIRSEEIEKAKQTMTRKIKQSFELEIKDKENEARDAKQRNETLMSQILELNTSMRSMKTRDEQRALELEKQVAQAQESAKQEALKNASDEHRMRHLEDQKKIDDMQKLIEELKRKGQQGSMQTQGEVLELDWEQELRTQFPYDSINPVGKGVRGADVEHIVKTPMGNIAGTILWENKRTKHWDDKWIDKLKADQRSSKVEVAALISQALPTGSTKEIINIEKVWVTKYAHALPLAHLLRDQLLAVAKQKAIANNSNDDATHLYEYMTSHIFTHQIEAIIEVYLGLQEQIVKERAAFEKQWAQREMQTTKLYKSLFSMYGGLTGIMGQSMPQIKGLELSELGGGEDPSDTPKLL